jgi:two-component system NtrC family sensor kinase
MKGIPIISGKASDAGLLSNYRLDASRGKIENAVFVTNQRGSKMQYCLFKKSRLMVTKHLKIFLLLMFSFRFAVGQQSHYLDSLRMQLERATAEDSFRVRALGAMAEYYGFIQFDSSLFYANKEAELSDKLNYVFGKFLSYRSKFFAFNCTGNYPMALSSALNFEKTYEEIGDPRISTVNLPHYFVGLLNFEMGDYPEAIVKFHKMIDLQKEISQPAAETFMAYSQLALICLKRNQLDSSLAYAQKGYDLGSNSKVFRRFYSLAMGVLGTVHVALKHYKLAEDLFHYGIAQSGQYNNIYLQARIYNNLASLFERESLTDSAIFYARISLALSRQHNFAEFTLNASSLLSHLYSEIGKKDSAFEYMGVVLAAKDSVFSQSRSRQFSQLAFDEILSQQKMATDKERYQNRIRLYVLISALVFFLLIAFLLYRNNNQKRKANLVLAKQKQKVESTLSELKATQTQLIQSEKMASLGELTAGIAHEIQNPLNFVNNFSEVNREMIAELKQEINNGNFDEVKIIADDLEANEEKINHHGKRADAIVKGMLQHSKKSSGQKELADINALADEYFRLAYHGLRAKDKDFNAELKTDFDPSAGKINIVSQDIGRVLLNLYNNAFYAVKEKSKSNAENYKPTVSVSTKKIDNKLRISVSDNGNGIPQNIVDKIFQPFFTTKPTGQGTGLGLSLAFDITKAHGGEIKVETKQGAGTEFILQLLIS